MLLYYLFVGDMFFELSLNNELITYNPNPIFFGITFDERLNSNRHFIKQREKALRRLNKYKYFFSQKMAY